MFHNLDQLQLELDRKNLYECDIKTCPKCLQKHFKEYTGYEPQPYRHTLLYEIDGLGKLIDERVLHNGKLWMEEREVKAIMEIENGLMKETDIKGNGHRGFGEVKSSLIAFHSKLNIFYLVLDHGSSDEHEKSIAKVYKFQ
ncbi:hypothetical protein Tco_0587871 [Tanacetum coccineum]